MPTATQRPRAGLLGVVGGTLGIAAGALGGCSGTGDYVGWWDPDKSPVLPVGGQAPVHAEAGLAADGGGTHDAAPPEAGVEAGTDGPPAGPIHTVFFVLMARQPWSAIAGSASAPYVNGTLLPKGAHATAYYAAPAQDTQSLPNVVWLEAGQDFGWTNNVAPTTQTSGTHNHLVDQLEAAGVTWKAYVEGAASGQCPIADNPPYRTWHVPFLYFDDVVGNPASANAKRCVQHVVPLDDLAADLASGSVPRYAFVVPDFCHDMHDDCNTGDRIRQGDDWLASAVPPIVASKAYASGGAVLVAWDYSNTGYVPVGMIALSPKARAGYASGTKHTASSTLRTLQKVFGVSPYLGDAANADDLGELFTSFP
jgi:hypothetical protein